MQVPHTALSRLAPSLFRGSGLFNPEFRSRKTCLAPSRRRFDATRLAPSALFHCGSRHAGDGTLVGAGMPATAPSATAATPVAAMTAPTDSSAPSPAIHLRTSKLQDWPRGSDLAVGAGMPATAPLWEPACPRRHPCGSRHAGDGTLRYRRDPSRCHGSSHRFNAATASHFIACFENCKTGRGAAISLWEPACRRRHPCGSRHAGDRATADRHGRCRFGFRAAAYRIATLGRAGPQTMSWRTTSSVWSSTPLSAS